MKADNILAWKQLSTHRGSQFVSRTFSIRQHVERVATPNTLMRISQNKMNNVENCFYAERNERSEAI